MIDYFLGLGTLLSYIFLYGYVAVFIVIFLGGLGVPMPSNTVLFAVAALASQHYFNFFLLLIVAVTANVLGDSCNYFIARTFGRALIRKNYHKRVYFIVRRVERHIKPLEERIQRHEGHAIIASRFVSPINTIANFLAGLVPVPVTTFVAAVVIGDFISIFIVLSLGFFVSQSWQNIAGVIGILGAVVSIFILAALAVAIFYFIRNQRPPKAM
jgi:membrane-associated protein